MTDNTEQAPVVKEEIKLRLEVFFREKCNRFRKTKNINPPIQGNPVYLYLKITNISDSIFKGAKIDDAHFEFSSINLVSSIDSSVQIQSLNPKESTTLKLDSTVLKVDGPSWFSLKLTPELETQEIQTYQYDMFHKTDSPYKNKNEWGTTIYIEGKLASLQATTNHYILLLTAITVWEAVFGIKDSFKWFSYVASKVFLSLAELFTYFANIT